MSSASIAGTVTDPDGKPIASARVCATVVTYDARVYEASTCSSTDTDGHYTLGSLAAHFYRVSAMAAGFATGSTAGSLPVLLGASESRVGVEIVLQRDGATITGVVVDATGGPVPHAKIRAERTETPTSIVDIEADALGRFALTFPPGLVALSAAAEAYSPAHLVTLAPSVDVRLVLIPGARARGVVVSKTDGQPVPNVEVRAVPSHGSTSPLFGSSVSDSSGAFDIRGLAPDAYTLVASGEGWFGQSQNPIGVSLGLTVEDIRVEVGPAARVLGRVLFADSGRPCEQGRVMLGPPDLRHPPRDAKPSGEPAQPSPTGVGADIEPQGVVRFQAVPPGHYYVSVMCTDNLLKEGPQVLDVGAKTLSNITWKVGPGLSLTVLTVDDRDRPVAGAEFLVRLPQWGPAGRSTYVPGRSDANGRYEVRNVLSAGTYEVAPIRPYEAETVRVELREGAGPFEAKIRISGSASIGIHVHGPSGKPIDGLAVFADPAESAPDAGVGPPRRFIATRLGEGRYRVAPLKPGRYEVRVEDGVNPPKSGGQLVLAAGESADSDIELDRDGQIRGHVVDEEGVALADAWVTATAGPDTSGATPILGVQQSESSRVLTDPDGQFVMEGLSGVDASYALRAELPSGALGVRRGVKAGEQDVVVTIRSPGSLAGNVGGGCGGAAVILTAMNYDIQKSMTQHLSAGGGPFVLRGVPPGHVQLRAMCEDGTGVGEVDTELSPKQNVTGLRLEPERLSAAPPLGASPVGGGPSADTTGTASN